MNLKALVGVGHKIMLSTLFFALLAAGLSVISPGLYLMDLGLAGTIVGVVFLAVGIPLWFSSAALVAINVPRGKLITTGPFKVMVHPLYTSVGLLVIPGIGFILNNWIWLCIGIAMYISSRVYSTQEEKVLKETFADEYQSYRANVLLPWL